jgi:hypothetical protein
MARPYGDDDVVALSMINEFEFVDDDADDDDVGCCCCSCFTKNIESVCLRDVRWCNDGDGGGERLGLGGWEDDDDV